MLSLTIQKMSDAIILHCAGQLTFPNAETLRAFSFQRPFPQTLVVDLADVIAVDAAGLGALLAVRARFNKTGTVLKLMNVNPRVLGDCRA